ncbi:DUF4011 domain-containing protein [Mycoplasma sp. 4013]
MKNQTNIDVNLRKWKQKLLDLSNRNNAITFKVDPLGESTNFKTKNKQQIQIINPTFQEILSIFQNTENKVFKIKTIDESSQIQYNTKSNIFYTNSETEEIDARLKNIYKKVETFKNEYSIDILYFTIGLLKWYEDSNSDVFHYSPLLFIPITLKKQENILKIEFTDTSNVIINESLLLKLKEDFGIFVEWNLDENLDLYTQYQELSSKILNSYPNDTRWKIIDYCYISTFDFTKIVIYEDIQKNSQKIIESNFYKGFQGKGDLSNYDISSINSDNINSHIDVNTEYRGLDADSSQEVAIQNAIKGKSFVLQGPPGTGKSQTITNIITELIARNKKVLFVAEKNTALQVVFNNLKKIGLEKYVVAIHDGDLNKRKILNDIITSIENSKFYELDSEKTDALLAKHNNSKDILDAYGEILIKKRKPQNLNLYEYISEYYKLENYPDIEFYTGNFSELSLNEHENILEKIDSFYKAYKELNFDMQASVWYGLNINQKNQQIYQSLKESIWNLINNFANINEYFNNILLKPSNIFINNFQKIFMQLNLYTKYNIQLYKFANYAEFIQINDNLKTIFNKKSENNKLLDEFIEHFVDVNVIQQIKIQEINSKIPSIENSWTRIFSSAWKYAKKLLKKSSFKVLSKQDKGISNLYKKVAQYLKNNLDIKEIWNKLGVSVIDDVDKLNELIDVFDKIIEFNDTESNGYISFLTNLSYINQMINDFEKFYSNWNLFISFFDKKQIDYANYDYQQLISKIQTLQKNFYDTLEPYIELNWAISELKYINLDSFVNAIINNKITNYFQEIYLRKNYQILIQSILWNEVKTNQAQFLSTHLDILREKEIECLSFSKQKVKQKNDEYLSYKLSLSRNNPEYRIIKAESQKKRNFLPFKKIFEKAYNFILDVKPCLLLSPLMVSNLFKDIDFEFDTVIFDEASQIKPEKAICSLFRAKQAIIVGDQEQMPASDFFEKQLISETYIDEESEDISSGYDSLLDFVASRYDSIRLKWHYRSKFEELIHTSNQMIYRDLITFPNSRNPKKFEGLNFIYAENDTFNKKEDIFVLIEETKKLLKDIIETHRDKYSVGIVVFNVNILDKVEREIEKFRESNPELAYFFEKNKDEPFFVKSIDGVQGDERDIVIFIIEAKRISKDRFGTSFGAINRSNSGYKRLNVAITRSKIGMHIISNFTSSQIDWFRSESRGIKILEQFIKNAEFGISNLSDNDSNNGDVSIHFDSGFEKQVYDKLIMQGLMVRTQVGVSGYRIDLGIVNPKTNKFILGIECDGALYHSSKSTRDRDRLRQQVLETRGWIIHRIWSTDWFNNPDREVQKILNKLKELEMSKTNQSQQETGIPKIANNVHQESLVNTYLKENKIPNVEIFEKYWPIQKSARHYKVEFNLHSSLRNKLKCKEILLKIFEKSGALTFNKFLAFVKILLEENSTTNKVKDFAQSIINRYNLILDSDEFVYPDSENFKFIFRQSDEDDERRPINEIHNSELQHLILTLFKYANVFDFKGISTEILSRTNNKALTVNTKNKIKSVIDKMIDNQLLEEISNEHYKLVKAN